MISEVLRIGDQCVVEIPKENREWGYNPCDDGEIVTVIGFGEIYRGRNNGRLEPGVYENRSNVHVRLKKEQLNISSTNLEMFDQDEYKRRVEEWHKNKTFGERLRDLPETKFWEGDIVKSDKIAQFAEDELQIAGIMHWDESPLYQVDLPCGFTYLCEHEMELVRRGLIWNHYHGEPLHFKDLKEEIAFHMQLGHYKEVRNPKTENFKWTLDEVLDAIEEGIVHGFSVNSLFGVSVIQAVRFFDEDLGARATAETLTGFGRSAKL